MGLVASFVALMLLLRTADDAPFHRFYLVVFGIAFVPLAIDVLTSYLGIRETNNVIRYVTGFLSGISSGVFVFFGCRVESLREKVSGGSGYGRQALFALFLAAGCGMLFLFCYPFLGRVSAGLVAVCLLLSVYIVVYSLLSVLSSAWSGLSKKKRLAACTVLSAVVMVVFGMAKTVLY